MYGDMYNNGQDGPLNELKKLAAGFKESLIEHMDVTERHTLLKKIYVQQNLMSQLGPIDPFGERPFDRNRYDFATTVCDLLQRIIKPLSYRMPPLDEQFAGDLLKSTNDLLSKSVESLVKDLNMLGMSDRTYQELREQSLVEQALIDSGFWYDPASKFKNFGFPTEPNAPEVPPSPEWHAFMARNPEYFVKMVACAVKEGQKGRLPYDQDNLFKLYERVQPLRKHQFQLTT